MVAITVAYVILRVSYVQRRCGQVADQKFEIDLAAMGCSVSVIVEWGYALYSGNHYMLWSGFWDLLLVATYERSVGSRFPGGCLLN